MKFIRTMKKRILRQRILSITFLCLLLFAGPVGNAIAQDDSGTIRVSGIVTDNTGGPLPGVTILLKGTTIGTTSNVDGEYVFQNVPCESTLVFSFVGMKKKEN